MRPLIGLTTEFVDTNRIEPERGESAPKQDTLLCAMNYPEFVEKAGGVPVLLPNFDSAPYLDALTSRLDGLILTGGQDVDPRRYGQEATSGLDTLPERDAFELGLLARFIGTGKPIFGICRGMQLFNVYLGGTLHQDIGDAGISEREHSSVVSRDYSLRHKVHLTPGSRIAEIMGRTEATVNSYHHQVVNRVARGLDVTALSEDGLIEGLESATHPFLLGVQWHPEKMAGENEEEMDLFHALVRAASGR